MSLDRHIERIASSGVDITLFLVPWDSELFGFAVAQIESITVKHAGDHADAMSRLREWLDQRDVHLASCRLPSGNLRESMLLEANGFCFVEMVYVPTLSPIPAVEDSDKGLVISKALPEDLPELETIAASAFSTGRFLLDWRLDGRVSNRRYQHWVRTSLNDPRHQVLKGVMGDKLVGFFIVEHRSDDSVYWHLAAIAPGWQGKGMGKRLWGAMVARNYDEGRSRIDTTISAHNTLVMNFYARLGFQFSAPQSTFHWVRT